MKERALLLLRNRPRHITYCLIAEQTNLTVSWLKLFGRDKISDPKISKIERLIKFFEEVKAIQ